MMLKEKLLSQSVRQTFSCGHSRHLPPALLALTLLASGQALAQDAPAAAKAADAEPQSVVVTGSRFGSRIVSESATPIDLVSAKELSHGGQLQLQSALKELVPSFSVSTPAATGGTLDFASSPTLRGLGPGELLLLVNGKRRHSMGTLNVNNQIGRGDVAYDFSTIPVSAIGRVEVLRDGASAQYGADAIAGVINIVLDKSLGGSASVMSGISTEGDGRVVETNASLGVPLGEDGVLRASVRLQDRNESNRSTPDTRQQYFGNNGASAASSFYGSGIGLTPSNGTLDAREATINRNTYHLGDTPFLSKAIFLNAEKPLAQGVKLYSFGGFSRLDGESYGFARRAAQDETVRSIYPDGYAPLVHVNMENSSLALGAKGEDMLGFDWDLSTAYGRSKVDTGRSNSNNASLGNASPTTDYFGGIRFGQWTSNLDLTRQIPLASGAPLKLALGLEFRKEYFEEVAGSLNSYQNGGATIIGGPNNGKPAPIGTQPSVGNSPLDASNNQRHSTAVYGELERDVTAQWMLSGAARHENFSDFGGSNTFKLATRYALTPALALRGSVSTGFRAPSLAQSYTSNTSTIFVNGLPVVQRLTPVNNPIAQALGATDLKPEKSRNVSIGAVWSEGAFTVSGDAYRIAIDDRLALSSLFQDARITAKLASLGYAGINGVSFMSNAIDTVTKGIDVTSSYRLPMAERGTLVVTASGNYNKTEIERISAAPSQLTSLGITTPLYDLTQQVRLTDASPKTKFVLGLNWKKGDWTVNLNNIRYGEVAAVAFTSLTPAQIAAVTPGYDVSLVPVSATSANSQVIQKFGAKIITDLNLSYQINKSTSVTVGSNNLFDVYPDKNLASTAASVAAGTNGSDNAGTFPYNYVSPFGYTGRTVFAKLDYKF
ncbi:TonB-dependent receptor plug domain-containing protein [Duganella aceris]|nr:TonB-dependent receptor [Duganella aceris]